jgi:hypothetical protein
LCNSMSASMNVESEWNFRIIEKRLVTIKAKNEAARSVSALDILTNMKFNVEVTETVDIKTLMPDTQYVLTLNVYTSKIIEGIDIEFVGFFEAVDIDQEMEDFIRSYVVYPTKTRFELIEAEEP